MDTDLVRRGWHLEVERGPDCLLVRLRQQEPATEGEAAGQLDDVLAATLRKHLVHRLVLDLADFGSLDRRSADQLAQLGRQLRAEGGLLRLCGLTSEAEEVLSGAMGQEPCPRFTDSHEAIVGHELPRPR